MHTHMCSVQLFANCATLPLLHHKVFPQTFILFYYYDRCGMLCRSAAYYLYGANIDLITKCCVVTVTKLHVCSLLLCACRGIAHGCQSLAPPTLVRGT